MKNRFPNVERRSVFMVAGAAIIILFSLPQNVLAQRTENPRIFGGPERQFANSVPAHVPLEFDIWNVESVRWAHELEIEVTNASSKVGRRQNKRR